jgi:two-component system cell cycle sensor histidine kinase/response regulator CckA
VNIGSEMIINNAHERGILVVDDEIDVIDFLKKFLNASGYCKIYEAQDGAEALSIIERHKAEIYIVLLDIAMPRMDGMSFLKHLVNVQSIPIGIEIITGWKLPNNQSQNKFFSLIRSQTVIPFNVAYKPFNNTKLLNDIEIALDDIHKKRLSLIECSLKSRHDICLTFAN